MLTALSDVMALRVGCASRHEICPYVPDVQQLGAWFGTHGGVASMFGMHSLMAHTAAASQFGPPSVARITNVRPLSPCRCGTNPCSVAAVGVPPPAT